MSQIAIYPREKSWHMLPKNTWLDVNTYPIVDWQNRHAWTKNDNTPYGAFMISVDANKGREYAYVYIDDVSGDLRYADEYGTEYTAWGIADIDSYMIISNVDSILLQKTSLLQKAIDKWGTDTQINKIQEEALELALALNQRYCPTKDPDQMERAIYEELADMKIMIAQAEMLFDAERINEEVKFKLNRLHQKYFK